MISFAGPVKGIFATLREILKRLLALFVIKSEDVFLIGSIQVATRPDCVHTFCGGEADPTITEESSAQVLCTVSLLWDLLSLSVDTIRASSVAVEEIQELCCLAQSDGFKGPGKRLHKI